MLWSYLSYRLITMANIMCDDSPYELHFSPTKGSSQPSFCLIPIILGINLIQLKAPFNGKLPAEQGWKVKAPVQGRLMPHELSTLYLMDTTGKIVLILFVRPVNISVMPIEGKYWFIDLYAHNYETLMNQTLKNRSLSSILYPDHLWNDPRYNETIMHTKTMAGLGDNTARLIFFPLEGKSEVFLQRPVVEWTFNKLYVGRGDIAFSDFMAPGAWLFQVAKTRIPTDYLEDSPDKHLFFMMERQYGNMQYVQNYFYSGRSYGFNYNGTDYKEMWLSLLHIPDMPGI